MIDIYIFLTIINLSNYVIILFVNYAVINNLHHAFIKFIRGLNYVLEADNII